MKKAQLEGFEQVAIIAVVIIIGAIFLGVYMKIKAGSSKIENIKALEDEAVEIATRVSALPELQCTRNNVVTANCIDWLNVEILKVDSNADGIPDIMESNRDFYHTLFGFSKITVIRKKKGADPTESVIYNGGITFSKSKTFTVELSRLIYDPRNQGVCFALGKGSCNPGAIKVEMFVR